MNTLKKWLSHVIEIHVESHPSLHNPHLYVCLSRGRYQLSTRNAIYSFSDLYENFVLAFKHLNWDKVPGEEVLLLGLGLGSIPEVLWRRFHRKMHFTAVEIDENVAYLAQKYILRHLPVSVQVQIGDAHDFVMASERKFDLICMDVFLDDKIPTRMTKPRFLKGLEVILNAGGVLLFNQLARTPADVEKTRRYLDEVFLPTFPRGGYLDVKGNWMLVNDKQFVQA